MKEKQFYKPKELLEQSWFPYRSEVSIYKLIKSGKLKALNLGMGKVARFVIPVEEIQRFLSDLAKK